MPFFRDRILKNIARTLCAVLFCLGMCGISHAQSTDIVGKATDRFIMGEISPEEYIALLQTIATWSGASRQLSAQAFSTAAHAAYEFLGDPEEMLILASRALRYDGNNLAMHALRAVAYWLQDDSASFERENELLELMVETGRTDPQAEARMRELDRVARSPFAPESFRAYTLWRRFADSPNLIARDRGKTFIVTQRVYDVVRIDNRTMRVDFAAELPGRSFVSCLIESDVLFDHVRNTYDDIVLGKTVSLQGTFTGIEENRIILDNCLPYAAQFPSPLPEK